MQVLLANPRGFCAGVDRAIEVVEYTLERLGPPVYVRHEVVHNRFVVDRLKAKGVVFTDDVDEIPRESTVIFSAHGVSQKIRHQAKARDLKIIDATCPLVTKVHVEVARYSRLGYECILVGHAGHPEVEGTMGHYSHPEGGIYLVENVDQAKRVEIKNPDCLGLVTQTTLSVDDTAAIIDVLKARFPRIQSPKTEDICYATTNRQNAVKYIASQSDVFIVIGSKNSSNSNRLKELAARFGCQSYLVDNAGELRYEWFEKSETVGVTAGASAPESLVQEVITQLRAWGGETVHEQAGVEESIIFPLPKALKELRPGDRQENP